MYESELLLNKQGAKNVTRNNQDFSFVPPFATYILPRNTKFRTSLSLLSSLTFELIPRMWENGLTQIAAFYFSIHFYAAVSRPISLSDVYIHRYCLPNCLIVSPPRQLQYRSKKKQSDASKFRIRVFLPLSTLG